MVSKYPQLYRAIYGITLMVAAVSFFLPGLITEIELALSIALVLLLGIPHGATDHILFRNLSHSFLGFQKMWQFYLSYLGLGLLYGIVWWLFPVIALILFLLISVYHFGQSNWQYLYVPKISWLKPTIYMLWGGFVTLTPLLFHFEAVAPIISLITGTESSVLMNDGLVFGAFGLIIVNLLLVAGLWYFKIIFRSDGLGELLSILVLSGLYFITPPLLGFAIYFVFWHSMPSIMDQVNFLKQKRKQYSLGQYIKDTFPITVLVLSAITVGFLFFSNNQIEVEVGWMFVFISIVTLPHVILIELLYEEKLN